MSSGLKAVPVEHRVRGAIPNVHILADFSLVHVVWKPKPLWQARIKSKNAFLSFLLFFGYFLSERDIQIIKIMAKETS
jgi:hypothetical protein